MGAVTPGAVTPGAVTPGAVTPGAVTPGAVTVGEPDTGTPPRDAPGWRRALLLAVLLAALLALAAGAAGRVYRGPLFDTVTAIAALAAVATGLVLRRAPQWTVAPVSLALLAAYLVLAARWSAGAAGVTGPLPALLATGLRDGGPRLLTALIPVEAEPDTLLLPVILVWIAGLTAAELLLRAGRAPRALIPPVLLYALALGYAGPHGGVQGWRALAFVLLAAALPATARGGRSAGAAAVPLALAALLVAAVVAVPVIAGALPDRPADPRAAVTPPPADTLDEDPLARLSGWLANPDEPLFQVSLSGDARIAVAVLTGFDGVNWSVGGAYREAGRQFPPPAAPPDATARTVTQSVTIDDLRGRLVPVVAAPLGIGGIRVAYAAASGTVLADTPLAAGTRYTVVSRVDRPDPNLLPVAGVPSGPAVAGYLDAGEQVPADLQRLAITIAAGNGSAYQKAYALQRFLAAHYTLADDAPTGHAYPNLRFFLLAPASRGGQRGGPEQFATAYAVLGRLMGLPTRVVVGFTAPAGRHTIRGADALAWPEVLFDGLGWVPFDPLPRTGLPHRPLSMDYHPSPQPTPSANPSTAPPVLPSASPSRPAVRRAAAAGTRGGSPWPPLGVAVLSILVAALAAVVAARRWHRVRRLARGAPAERVRGGWLEVLDALRLAGRPPPAHLTVTGIAGWAARAVTGVAGSGADSDRAGTSMADGAYMYGVAADGTVAADLDRLAALANMVAFAPGSADDADAAVAVGAATGYVRALRARAPRWRRLLWPVHPGPLLWRRRAPVVPPRRAGGAGVPAGRPVRPGAPVR